MHTFDYFFSTKGKVERLPFLGLLVMSIVFSFIATLFTALFSKFTGSTNILFFPVSAVFLYATYCIYIKRFNDIGKMHSFVQIHFGVMAFFLVCLFVESINTFTVSVFLLNSLLGLVLLLMGLFWQGGNPIVVEHGEQQYTFTSSMLTRVNTKFVPNFETSGMLMLIGGGEELILTKQEYERRQHLLEYADCLYVFHLKDLQ